MVSALLRISRVPDILKQTAPNNRRHALFLSAMRRHMSVATEIMQPVMSGVVAFVISVPLLYSKIFTGWCFRRGDALMRQFPGSVNTMYFLLHIMSALAIKKLGMLPFTPKSHDFLSRVAILYFPGDIFSCSRGLCLSRLSGRFCIQGFGFYIKLI